MYGILILQAKNLIPTTVHHFSKILYAVCHMLSMSSACANPFLYGWLNENFCNEFRDICYCIRPVVITSPTPAGPMAGANESEQPGSHLKDLTTPSRYSNHAPVNSDQDNVNCPTCEVTLESSIPLVQKLTSTVVWKWRLYMDIQCTFTSVFFV